MFILPSIRIDRDSVLSRIFTPYQLSWIHAEDALHAQKQRAFVLAEKSVRIGWTFGDSFKNVRKRLRYKKRDYLFATKDWPSALEFMDLCQKHIEVFNVASATISHGEEFHKVPRLDQDGKPTAFTDDIRMGVIKFHNGSRILAFSSNPYAMAVYGGDVGLDEFAKHQRARLLWETAQGRITLGADIAVWSAHDGEDTLFNEFAQEARAGKGPWNLYYRVTIEDAIQLGLLDIVSRTQGKNLTPEQLIADCRSLAREDGIFQQSYMCNPLGSVANHIVEWSAIERCRYDYEIERVHLEAADISRIFGNFDPSRQQARQSQIESFLLENFPSLLSPSSIKKQNSKVKNPKLRLGFDVAASGQGDLAVIYIDEAKGDGLWLSALLTCRTEDWDFIKTVLFHFLKKLPNIRAAGDESGLGRQICWEAKQQFHNFIGVNFSAKKNDLGFALMNQLATAQKRFPSFDQDIAADFFALRKAFNGNRWTFSEARNSLNPDSHCDIAWAGALASFADAEYKNCSAGAAVLMEDGSSMTGEQLVAAEKRARETNQPPHHVLWSDDPGIWRRVW